jgi:hypothetical protein
MKVFFNTLRLFLASASWFEYPRNPGVMGDEKLFSPVELSE